jgi:hemoglobin-like flavoprotein
MKLTAHPLADPMPAVAGGEAPQTDQHLVLRLRLSLARMLAKGDELGVTFYALLFERAPALRPLFPDDMARQRSKLAQTLAWIVTHLDRRDETLAAVRALGRRHATYGAAREHYPLVRDTLLEAMRRTAGPDWCEQLAGDWRLSIDLICRHMMTASAAADGTTQLTTAAAAAAGKTVTVTAPAARSGATTIISRVPR